MSSGAPIDEFPQDALSLTFWGVRGSIPAPGPQTLRYGGETTCMEIRAGERTILIDCGSGVRMAGKTLRMRGIEELQVLFTHTHLDHICGLPFFCLAYDPNIRVDLCAGHMSPGGTLQEIVERLMSPPIFPVATSALNNTHFRAFRAGDTLEEGELKITTTRLNHPGNGTGYRFDYRGSSIAILTDHEHGDPEIDGALATFVEGASVMVYDAMYLPEEYPKFVGWGHSTPEKGLELAAQSGVGHTLLFHHDPSRTDEQLDQMGAALLGADVSASFARQGDTHMLVAGRLLEASMVGQAKHKAAPALR